MGGEYTQRVIGRLRSEGLKVTPQRIAIVRYLEDNFQHPSIDEIYRDVSRNFPTLSLATVYNTMDTLVRISEVRPIILNSERKHYDPDTRPHHHAVCDNCGKVNDVHADLAGLLQVPKELAQAFEIRDADILFKGLCATCLDN